MRSDGRAVTPFFPRWLRHAPVAIALLAALLELAVLGGSAIGDTASFLNHTRASGANVRFPTINPGYPLLLDLLCLLLPAGWRMGALVGLQQAAVVAIPWLLLRCGEQLGAPRAGWWAALFTALHAPLGFFAQTAQTDSLFAFLVAAAACSTVCASASGSSRAALVAGVLAAGALAQRSSGIVLAAAVAVAWLMTGPRRHSRLAAGFACGYAAVLGLVLVNNRFDYGDFALVKGRGIHLFCRVAALERALPATAEARELGELAREAALASPFVAQAGWELHRLLVKQRRLSQEAADALLERVALAALLQDPWRSLRLTWTSMTEMVRPLQPANYALVGTLTREGAERNAGQTTNAWRRSPAPLERARRLLPEYPPRLTAGAWPAQLLLGWGSLSRVWCGTWVLFALLAIGAFGLARRSFVLVFLAGVPFAQLAASAIGDRPFAGHFDPVVPLFHLAVALTVATLRQGFTRPARIPR